MEDAILEIVAALRAGEARVDAAWLDKLVRRHNRAAHDGSRTVAKRRLLPFYLDVKEHNPEHWASWDVDAETEAALFRLLRMKPRRSASGVATITVITKPWPCSSNCLYCPNDLRMPKSYLANEPACQRAERNYFDPYLQVKSRLTALSEMGHVTDKVELIVLGGTWSNYPAAYRRWFVGELFRALNDGAGYGGGPEETQGDRAAGEVAARVAAYEAVGIAREEDVLVAQVAGMQRRVDAGELAYNEAWRSLYEEGAWAEASSWQTAGWSEVEAQHLANETSAHRVVGLVIETRPDLISADSLTEMRRLGCTKIQMGIQSLDQRVLDANERRVSVEQIARAFELLRLFGFKTHVHFMVNLPGATPEADKADYLRLVSDPHFLPDEVKLYPCALIGSSRLCERFATGDWAPYKHDELVDVLASDVLATPVYTRISRMIRDFSSTDIVAGNKLPNLRQMVDERVTASGAEVHEIRSREVGTDDVSADKLQLVTFAYDTTVSEERFLQWVAEDGRIAGFLRLSLPKEVCDDSPISAGEAMIREVHVYGRVAGLGASAAGGAQHLGLGKALIAEACRQAREAGFSAINVISAVGTREYYRRLGFEDAGLYQRLGVSEPPEIEVNAALRNLD